MLFNTSSSELCSLPFFDQTLETRSHAGLMFLKMGIWYGNLLISVLNGAGILLLTMQEYWGIWVHQIINIHSSIEDAAIDVYYLWTLNINIHFPTENAASDVYYPWTHLCFLVWYIEYILVCNYGLGESTQVIMYSQGAWVLKLFTVTSVCSS
jgi:hypothetical protein